VDGAIHLAAGPELKEACQKLGGCRTGYAKITKAFRLPARYVIHTVGPKDQDQQKLRNCYISSLELLKLNNLRSIAFPSIATGAFGFPAATASRVALNAVKDWLKTGSNADCVDRIIFCVFNKRNFDNYVEAATELALPNTGSQLNQSGLSLVAKSQSPR